MSAELPYPDPRTTPVDVLDRWWADRAQAIGAAAAEQGRCPLCLVEGCDCSCSCAPVDDVEAEALLGIEPPPLPSMRRDIAAVLLGCDLGIRDAVAALNAAGLPTCQSCEGGDGHAYKRPTVDVLAETALPDDGAAILRAALRAGLPVRDVGLSWTVRDGQAVEPVWRVTLTAPAFGQT